MDRIKRLIEIFFHARVMNAHEMCEMRFLSHAYINKWWNKFVEFTIQYAQCRDIFNPFYKSF